MYLVSKHHCSLLKQWLYFALCSLVCTRFISILPSRDRYKVCKPFCLITGNIYLCCSFKISMSYFQLQNIYRTQIFFIIFCLFCCSLLPELFFSYQMAVLYHVNNHRFISCDTFCLHILDILLKLSFKAKLLILSES
jgi:hypothetical protein